MKKAGCAVVAIALSEGSVGRSPFVDVLTIA
jgi:hypothetical protein